MSTNHYNNDDLQEITSLLSIEDKTEESYEEIHQNKTFLLRVNLRRSGTSQLQSYNRSVIFW